MPQNGGDMSGKKRNEKYFPVVFLGLFPLACACAAIEFELFSGNVSTGIAIGGSFGLLCYAVWKKIA